MLGMEGEMLKGHLNLIVLAALSTGPAHGYAVIVEIRRRSGEAFNLPEGTVYPALHRLEEAGLLSSRWVTAESGRRRRIYALTRRGTRALIERRAVWQQFAAAIGGLLARISHTNRRIGPPNQRKLLCCNDFTQVRGAPDADRV
jgi:PadR family transcriptional regulator, regulatory protein PadR